MVGPDYAYSNLPFAVSCGVDTFVVSLGLAWAARGRMPYRRLPVIIVVATLTLAVKGAAMVASGLNQFGVIHVAWLDLVIVLPIAAVGVLVSTRLRTCRALVAVALAALLLVFPVGIYASFVEPSRTMLERVDVSVPAERSGSRSVRIVVVADLQFDQLGGHEREAIDLVMAQHPDVILIAGDIHQGTRASFERQLGETRVLLGRLKAPDGTYAVQGDVEGLGKARRAYAGTGVRLLVNETAAVRVGDRKLTIGGVQLRYRSPGAREATRRLAGHPGAGDIRILLAHRPDAVLGLAPQTRVDLTVAGHTHGGQVQLPGIGAITTASDLPRRIGAGGLHEMAGRRIYVSRGIGVERGQAPRVRLGAPPEVSLLTLRSRSASTSRRH